ncbi:hypothetical protein Vadar_033394 [Vaccinium darrowii]|uniref:Uncharacterized protein n=1 Tax=Vaccinium darrowii TaxID=229202 RepID=A0ACB7YI81_9ERIC|nr:hypothetical protein Vadar_033394 [Vaccinium darrowii]
MTNVKWNTSIKEGKTANAWVNYNSTTEALSVYLTYAKNPVFQGYYSLSHVVNLRTVLPEWVRVGFSASTDDSIEIHSIISWTFNSTFGGSYNSTSVGSPSTACGRKSVELKRDPGQVRLLEWVWSFYGKGQLFEAVDEDLTMEYDEDQAERLMVVGLWCCHPDLKLRPSIRQAINVLTFEALLPDLPSQMPITTYFSLPMCMFSYTASIVTTDSSKDRTQCSCSSNNRSHGSSLSVGSSEALLQLDEPNA